MIKITKIISFIKTSLLAVDPILMLCSLILSLLSLLTLVGARSVFGARVIVMQLAMTVAGVLFVIIMANLDLPRLVDKLAIPLFIIAALIIAYTVIFGVAPDGGDSNKSWVEVPFVNTMIQPAEFVKVFFILTFAKHLDMVKDKINRITSLLGLAVHAGVIVGLVLLTGDLGVALIYLGILLVMLFCAGLSLWYYLGAAVVGVLAFPYIWELMADYQKNRILVGFDPDSDPLGYGMQALLSRQAIANGGLFGKGFSGGTVFEVLPEAETDFIFATYSEKFGFVGSIFLIGLLAVIIVRVVIIALRAKNTCGGFICAGISAVLIIQTIENLGMCLCMLPVIGITLPFMSAGGSSVLSIYLTVGLAHSVRRSTLR